jgi:hypothetical protein
MLRLFDILDQEILINAMCPDIDLKIAGLLLDHP